MGCQPSRRYDALSAVHDWFVGGGFRREVAAFAADGMGVVAMSTQGKAGHVDFDFFRIWGAMKAAPRMPRKVWMFHTHPGGCSRMSAIDANASKGWATALGMPVEMVIVTGVTMRYLCLKGNVIIDLGLRDGPPSENLLVATMCGLSWADGERSQEELDEVADGLNRVIPLQTWDCDHRTSLCPEGDVGASGPLHDADPGCAHEVVDAPGG